MIESLDILVQTWKLKVLTFELSAQIHSIYPSVAVIDFSCWDDGLFIRRFRRKTRLLQWLVFFRQFNAIGPHFVHYALLPYVLSTSFLTHPKPLNKLFQSRRVPLSPKQKTRLSPFFRHCETVQISHFPPSFFWYFATEGCSKNPKGSPLLHFLARCDLPETSKKIRKKIRKKIFPQFLVFFESFCCLEL